MNLDEKKLFCQLKNGSSNAFEQLYVAYKAPAFKFCYSLLKDRDEAEGMVQDVFLQLWVKRSRLNTEASFKSYLFSCLRNKAYDFFKLVKRNESLKSDLWQRIKLLQELDEEEDETLVFESLKKAVDTLPNGRKHILQLRYEGGKSYKEIAEQLNISIHTVKNQLIKAKHHLKTHVDISLIMVLIFSIF
ncbi:RNA polymerase sigma factor [Flexithrix dorotheae]|uniref:RNA polymerase sigma factor n=1 Tax=Flexithrix dorotheae TaxID=70993 RepID=UPI0003747670|nr:RNA polymerase sigma-70 factor [Flexithrix dorotheae]